MFVSPNRMQFEAMSSCEQFLAVSTSKLGGNEWGGELRVFSANDEKRFDTFAAITLEYGTCCNTMFQQSNVACGGDDGNVLLFALSQELGLSKTHEFALHEDLVSCLTANDYLIASGSWDRTCHVYDPTQGKSIQHMRCKDVVAAMGFMDNNVLIVGETNGSISGWDIRAGNVAMVFQTKVECTTLCSLNVVGAQGQVLVGCGDGSIKELELQHNICKQIREQGPAAVHALAYCKQTGRLLSGADDGSVMLDLVLSKSHMDFVRGVAFWNTQPVSSSWDGTVRFVE